MHYPDMDLILNADFEKEKKMRIMSSIPNGLERRLSELHPRFMADVYAQEGLIRISVRGQLETKTFVGTVTPSSLRNNLFYRYFLYPFIAIHRGYPHHMYPFTPPLSIHEAITAAFIAAHAMDVQESQISAHIDAALEGAEVLRELGVTVGTKVSPDEWMALMKEQTVGRGITTID